MCEMTFAVTTSEEDKHKALRPKTYSLRSAKGNAGDLKQKLFTNNDACWKNSDGHIHNTAVNTFGKGYTVQQRRLNVGKRKPATKTNIFNSLGIHVKKHLRRFSVMYEASQ